MPVIHNKQKVYFQPALAALCAITLFLALYFVRGMYPFGSGSIMITDLYSQYVPLLYRFYDVITGEKNLFLDLSLSGGANLYVDTVNEVINPFNYVLLFFGRDMIYKAVNVVLLLYVGASAASIDFFLLKVFPGKQKWNPALSLCYALSGYMAYNYQVIKWMYFPVIFPLFCLALRRLIREGKGGMYAILLCYQLSLNIQLGFMALLFTLFSSGIYFYCCVKKEDRAVHMCRLGVYTIAGLMLSGVVIVPNILILLSSSRAGENLSYLNIMKMHGLDDLFERLFQIAHPVLLAMSVWLLIGLKQRRKTGKHGSRGAEGRFLILLNVFLWLTVLLQPANLIWHMGSYVCFPVRYAYMVLLSGICLIKWMLLNKEDAEEAEGIDDKGENRKIVVKPLIGICIFALCMIACMFTFLWNDKIVQAFSSLAISLACPKETVQVCIILLLLFFAALCALMSACGRQLLLFVSAVCGLCFWLFIFLPQDYGVRISNEAAYQTMAQQAEGSGSGAFQHVKCDPELPPNAALVNNQSSLTGYLPTGNLGFQNTMEELGYLVRWVATQDVGGTAISDELLSEGRLFYRSADELTLKGTSVLERQEEMGIFAAGESHLKRIAGSGAQMNESGEICLSLSGRQVVYLDSAMAADSFTVLVNGKEVEMPEAGAYYGPHRIVELGTFTDEEIEILIIDKSGSPLPIDNMEFAMLDKSGWSDALCENNPDSARLLTNQEVTVDAVRGRIRVTLADAEAGQTVFLPVAAADGWKCVLNGKKTDISNVFGFLGIAAESGHNEMVLTFIPPGLWIGSILTFLGFAWLAACLLPAWIRQRRSSVPQGSVQGAVPIEETVIKERAIEETAIKKAAIMLMGLLYRLSLAGSLAMVYIIPAAGLAAYIVTKLLKVSGITG